MDKKTQIRERPPKPPSGLKKLAWYGPGWLWMLSSVGSGSVLFTPRVGSRYGYALLWAAMIVFFFMWVMIHEVGRYTVVTGRTLMEGFKSLPGPNGWAVWLIFLPQVLAAVVTIAGIAALAGSALMIAFPGNQALYATGLIVFSMILVLSGKYKGVERISTILSAVLIVAAVSAAMMVVPAPMTLLAGLVPSLPRPLDLYFILPWIGFILAGAAGLVWFSYWVSARGYGGSVTGQGSEVQEPVNDPTEQFRRLRAWNRIMGNTAAIGVAGGALVIVSFMILGAQILGPAGIVPEGIAVAADLTRLLSGVWGAAGRWILLLGIIIALWGTILADQDGWGRLFADATLLLKPGHGTQPATGLSKILDNRETLKNIYAVLITAVLPLVIFFLVRKPVEILSVAGIVAAAHTPVVVFLTYYLNNRHLPRELQPGWLLSVAMILAGCFYLAFAVVYLFQQLGVQIM